MTHKLLKGWRTVRLGELCDICRGSSPRPIADQRFFEGGTIPWVKIADATISGKFLFRTKQYVNEYGASFSRLLPKGSLIIAASGVTLGYAQMLGVDGCAHDGWLIPSNYRGLDKHFLYYLFLEKNAFFHKSSYGAAIQNINTDILREMEISIPSLPAQRKIAFVLSVYDDLIDNNTRRIAILEAMAQAIYREWFVEFRFLGHEKINLINSPLGKIPEGWKVEQLGNVSDLQWGDTKTTKAKYVEEGYTAYSAAGADGFLDYFDFDRTGVILSAIGANCGRTWYGLGKWSCIKNTIRFWASHQSPSTEFLYLATNDLEFWPRRGAAQPFISQQDARQKQIVVPSHDIETHFAATAKDILLGVHSLSRKNANLRKTRDLLLPKLISGQLDVEELDIEIGEPLVEVGA